MSAYSDFIESLGPALYWPLDAENGATDLSGNGRHGTGQGGTVLGGHDDGPPFIGDSATDFDGIDDRITSTYNPFVNGTQRTFCGWATRDNSAAFHPLFANTLTSPRAHLVLDTDQDVLLEPNSAAGAGNVNWVAGWPGNTQWVHWVLVVDEPGDTGELFIDGASQGVKAVTDAWNVGAGTFQLGREVGTFFDGKMAHLAIFERALSAIEIADLAGFRPPPAFRVDELPPDEPSVHLIQPNGSEVRIAGDEIGRPLSDITWGSTLPGGWSTADADFLFPDGHELRGVRKFAPAAIRGPDGGLLAEYRLDTTPQRSAESMVRLAMVGHQALLADAAGITFLGVLSDLSAWEEPPVDREIFHNANNRSLNTKFSAQVANGGLVLRMEADTNVPTNHVGEIWLIPPGVLPIAEVQYVATQLGGTSMDPLLVSADDLQAAASTHGFTATLTLVRTAISPARRYVGFRDTPTATVNKLARSVRIHRASAFGDHELPRVILRDGTVPDGLYFSDVLAHLVGLHTPLNTEIEPSSIGLPNLAWLDPTDLGAILEEGVTYERERDWGVWTGPTLHYGKRQNMGRTWIARRSEGAEMVDLDQAAEPEHNTVIVVYQRPDGTPARATPPGGGGDVEDLVLRDEDPDNPVNASPLCRDRPLIVDLPDPVEDEVALELGEAALLEAIRPRFAGQVNLPRYAEVGGRMRPTTEVRADDWIVDGDRPGSEPMPLVEATYQRSSERPCTVTVDQPDNTLAVAIARMGARPRKLNRKRIRRKLRRQRKRLRKRGGNDRLVSTRFKGGAA